MSDNRTTKKQAATVAEVVQAAAEEKRKGRCAEAFQLGIDYYLDGGLPFFTNLKEFRRRLWEVFERSWARGEGNSVADRHGYEFDHVAWYAAQCARNVVRSMQSERWKAEEAAAEEAAATEERRKKKKRHEPVAVAGGGEKID